MYYVMIAFAVFSVVALVLGYSCILVGARSERIIPRPEGCPPPDLS